MRRLIKTASQSHHSSSHRRCGQPESRKRFGGAMVEFAVLAPLFLSLVIGTVEFGNALNITDTLTASIREGGRLASMDWDGVIPDGMTPNQKVIADIRNFLIASGVPHENLEISITSAQGDDAGEPFDLADPDNKNRFYKIRASIPYDDVSFVPGSALDGEGISAELIMRAGRIRLMN